MICNVTFGSSESEAMLSLSIGELHAHHGAPQSKKGQGDGHHRTTSVDHAGLVAHCFANDHSAAVSAAQGVPHHAARSNDGASREELAHGCHGDIRASLAEQGLSEDVISVISSSWRDGTNNQYRVYISEWSSFCNTREDNAFSPSIVTVLDFLNHIFNNGVAGMPVGYSTVNTARSALSTFINIEGVPVGKHFLVRRFMKGVFNLKPALPRYECSGTWDLNIMLDFLYKLAPVAELSLKHLTYKLVMLLCILSGQRSQSIHLFNVQDMQLSFNRVEFVVTELTKTSKPGSHNGVFEFRGYPPNRRLCVVTVLKEYLERTLTVRKTCKQLFLTHIAPHTGASSDTVKRWVRECLTLAGIDVDIFKAHSVRGASTSFASRMNISMDLIMRTAGWQAECTFTKFYKLPVKKNFGAQVIEAHVAQR